MVVAETIVAVEMGFAHVTARVIIARRQWRQLLRHTPGPRFWERLRERWSGRGRVLCKVFTVSPSALGSGELRCICYYDHRRGCLEVGFPQDVGLTDVPAGSELRLLRQEWAEPGFLHVPEEQKSEDVKGLSCCVEGVVLLHLREKQKGQR
jgi:hypothetical protein